MSKKTNAIITASHAPDFERCKILCETMDQHASGHECHYILVDGPDAGLFGQLEGPRRKVLTDTQLLPWWIRRAPKSLSPNGRRVWLSPITMPMHGWHMQQIMRIAIAHHLDVDGLLYCDSDTAFLRDYDLSQMWDGDHMRLWRQSGGAETAIGDHLHWVTHSARAFGLPQETDNKNNYVCSFVSWRRQTVLDMCAHMEKQHRRHWIAVVASSRKFSECMLYGTYVDSLIGGKDHWSTQNELCPMKWRNPAPSEAELAELVANLAPHEVGLGVQSFIPLPPETFRAAVTNRLAAAA